MFIIETGINHFGKKKELDLITNYIFKLTFKYLTLMCHFSDFYKKYKKKGINFEISEKTYSKLIKKFYVKLYVKKMILFKMEDF